MIIDLILIGWFPSFPLILFIYNGGGRESKSGVEAKEGRSFSSVFNGQIFSNK